MKTTKLEQGHYTTNYQGLEIAIYRGLYGSNRKEWTVHVYNGHNRKVEGFSSKQQCIQEIPSIVSRLLRVA